MTEAERSKKDGRQGAGPVWSTRAGSDESFDYGIDKTLSTIARQNHETGSSRVPAAFANHNSVSVDLGISPLEKYGLPQHSRP